MKRTDSLNEDDPRAEYDFAAMRDGVRGKYDVRVPTAGGVRERPARPAVAYPRPQPAGPPPPAQPAGGGGHRARLRSR